MRVCEEREGMVWCDEWMKTHLVCSWISKHFRMSIVHISATNSKIKADMCSINFQNSILLSCSDFLWMHFNLQTERSS